MTNTAQFTITDGVQVVSPDSLDLITPYVLQEQLDWFEDEIKFVRHLLKPGQQIIDIGANYGVYTLSMAHAVGEAGHIWAFEPASQTAQLLRQGVAANHFEERVTVVQSALSHRAGTAELSLNANSELNALQAAKSDAVKTETVALATLDEWMQRNQWRDIAFMKMDAEGEEANILRGGTEFFAKHSPLVMYEIKEGQSLHLDLVTHFDTLGYQSYRLVPGLNVLVPFDVSAPADGYLLNLFCCKADRAGSLEAGGLLVTQANIDKPSTSLGEAESYHWRRTLAQMPYVQKLSELWNQTAQAGNNIKVEEALSLYCASQDLTLKPAQRYRALDGSYQLLKQVCEQDSSYLRLASFARVAADYGARHLAVHALQTLSSAIEKLKWMDPSEPFLVPCARFEKLDVQEETFANWVMSATLEALECLNSFSSFYSGMSARQRLETIRKLGFGDEHMQRRLHLVKKRFGLPI